MLTLLRRGLRRTQPVIEDDIPDEPADEVDDSNRLLLLIPTESGFSFRLLAFPGLESAHAYIQHHFPQRPPQRMYAFWALHGEPQSPNQPVEAVVMVRDPERPGQVTLSSFIDMDSAQAFLRAETQRGINPVNALIYWAAPATLEAGTATSAAPVQPPAVVRPTYVSAAAPPAPASPPPAPRPAARTAPQAAVQPAAQPAPRPAPRAATPPPAPVAASVRRAPKARAAASTVTPYAVTPPAKHEKRQAAPKQAQPAAEPTSPGIIDRIRAWPGWDGLGPRLIAACTMKRSVYEEIDGDENATGRAALVVGLAALAAGVGASTAGPSSVIAHVITAALGFGVYAGGVYLAGMVLFTGAYSSALFQRLTLSLGLAFAPALLLFLGIVPIYGPLLVLGVLLWVLCTSVVATGQVLELESQPAALAVVLAWLFLFAITLVLPGLLV